jgi:two-component system CheB/CheR fusion protein
MPYRTLDDRIDGLVITFDITASKKAEETLLKENRYRRLFESAKDGILYSMQKQVILLMLIHFN